MQEPHGYVVIAEFRTHGDRVADFLAAAREHARNALDHEPGCLQFDVVQDSTDPTRVIMYEVYRDEAAFAEHQVNPHLARTRPVLQELAAERTIHKLARIAHPRRLPGANGKILVAAPNLRTRLHLLKPLEAVGLELVANPHTRNLTEAELITMLAGASASLAGSEPYNDAVFAASPALRVVARLGVGYDQIDVAAATRHGVAIAMAFGANHEAVADHTLALMGGLSHRLLDYQSHVRGGGWGSFYHARMYGTTVGLIGFGRIGRAVAKRCQGFNMEVLVADPIMDAETVARLGCRLVSHDELMAAADFVSIHCPRQPSTIDLVDARRLALMKPTAFLINTARGGIVNEPALHAALAAGRIAGAGLDVFATEPPLGSPLLELPNVLLTPHAAGVSEWAVEQMARRAVENVLAILRGEDPGSGLVLNPEVLEAPRADAAD